MSSLPLRANVSEAVQTTVRYLLYQLTMNVKQYLKALESGIAALENS